MSQQVKVSDETYEVAQQVAKEKECTIGEAVDHVFSVGVSRLSALRKYAKTQKAKGAALAPKAKKAKAPKAKPAKAAPAKAKKTPKAKVAKVEEPVTEAAVLE